MIKPTQDQEEVETTDRDLLEQLRVQSEAYLQNMIQVYQTAIQAMNKLLTYQEAGHKLTAACDAVLAVTAKNMILPTTERTSLAEALNEWRHKTAEVRVDWKIRNKEATKCPMQRVQTQCTETSGENEISSGQSLP